MIKLYGPDKDWWRLRDCANEQGFLNATSVKMLFVRCVEIAVFVLQRYGLIPKSPLGRIKFKCDSGILPCCLLRQRRNKFQTLLIL